MTQQSAVLLLLACTFFGCTKEEPKGKVVFQSNRDSNFEIYSMDDDGMNLQRLTNSPSYEVSPSWSPGGSQILFASDRGGNWDIYVMNADGSNPGRLTMPPGSNTSPCWGMEGKKILFVSTRDVMNGELYMMNADGSGVERLTNDGSVKDSPQMSPDGMEVVYIVNNGQRSMLMFLNVSDKSMRSPAFSSGNCVAPGFSPDGSLVIFASDRDGMMTAYEMASSGGEPRKLTKSSDEVRTPSYGSSAKQILYSKNGSVCMLSLESNKEKILSNKGDFAPRWTSN